MYKLHGNILNVFGDIKSNLPQIFYNCEILFPNHTTGKINKLYLFINNRFHQIYSISNIYPEELKRDNTNIIGYFYDSIISNIDSHDRFDIICKDGNTKILVKDASIKRSSNGSNFSYHSFIALSYKYI